MHACMHAYILRVPHIQVDPLGRDSVGYAHVRENLSLVFAPQVVDPLRLRLAVCVCVCVCMRACVWSLHCVSRSCALQVVDFLFEQLTAQDERAARRPGAGPAGTAGELNLERFASHFWDVLEGAAEPGLFCERAEALRSTLQQETQAAAVRFVLTRQLLKLAALGCDAAELRAAQHL